MRKTVHKWKTSRTASILFRGGKPCKFTLKVRLHCSENLQENLNNDMSGSTGLSWCAKYHDTAIQPRLHIYGLRMFSSRNTFQSKRAVAVRLRFCKTDFWNNLIWTDEKKEWWFGVVLPTSWHTVNHELLWILKYSWLKCEVVCPTADSETGSCNRKIIWRNPANLQPN